MEEQQYGWLFFSATNTVEINVVGPKLWSGVVQSEPYAFLHPPHRCFTWLMARHIFGRADWMRPMARDRLFQFTTEKSNSIQKKRHQLSVFPGTTTQSEFQALWIRKPRWSCEGATSKCCTSVGTLVLGQPKGRWVAGGFEVYLFFCREYVGPTWLNQKQENWFTVFVDLHINWFSHTFPEAWFGKGSLSMSMPCMIWKPALVFFPNHQTWNYGLAMA